MAKRTPQSSAQDLGATPAPPKPKARRPRAAAPSASPGTGTLTSSVESRERTGAGLATEAGDDAPLESLSMGSEPSEEEIRLRAYMRYLERGGGHGMDFEDWLEAERELKSRS
jgi:DUF2934 family protein